METWNEEAFRTAGIDQRFRQDNHSRSRRGVLRGLHYQITRAQGKLVRCVRGSIFDVAVDLRRSSPHFGKWTAVELSEHNSRMLWIPPGFAHGFLALADNSDVLYKTTELYDPAGDRTVLWSDPAIGIRWPLADAPVLSDKDGKGNLLRDAETYS
jgi:dTDP-4-dehydrorhamnose 3,5-epimerase